ncbi:unnamed protein product [Lota lota]
MTPALLKLLGYKGCSTSEAVDDPGSQEPQYWSHLLLKNAAVSTSVFPPQRSAEASVLLIAAIRAGADCGGRSTETPKKLSLQS